MSLLTLWNIARTGPGLIMLGVMSVWLANAVGKWSHAWNTQNRIIEYRSAMKAMAKDQRTSRELAAMAAAESLKLQQTKLDLKNKLEAANARITAMELSDHCNACVLPNSAIRLLKEQPGSSFFDLGARGALN